MSLSIIASTTFKKDLKICKRRNKDLTKIKLVIDSLISDKKLDYKYYVHNLKGEYSSFSECHIEPDWLLIYKIDYDNSVLYLVRTGTHSDLF